MNALSYLPLLGPWKDLMRVDVFNDFWYVTSTQPHIQQLELAFATTYREHMEAVQRHRAELAAQVEGMHPDDNEVVRLTRALVEPQLARLDNIIVNRRDAHLDEIRQLNNRRIEAIKHRSYSYVIGDILTLLLIPLICFVTEPFSLTKFSYNKINR